MSQRSIRVAAKILSALKTKGGEKLQLVSKTSDSYSDETLMSVSTPTSVDVWALVGNEKVRKFVSLFGADNAAGEGTIKIGRKVLMASTAVPKMGDTIGPIDGVMLNVTGVTPIKVDAVPVAYIFQATQ